MTQVSPVGSTVESGTVQNAAVAQQSLAEFRASRAFNQSVAGAVRSLNDIGYAGPKHEVTFSVDAASRLSVVKVIDKNTSEVIQQWPAEYVLHLAAEYANHT